MRRGLGGYLRCEATRKGCLYSIIPPCIGTAVPVKGIATRVGSHVVKLAKNGSLLATRINGMSGKSNQYCPC